MKTIALIVPPKVARAFEQADASVKQKAETLTPGWTGFLSKQRPSVTEK